MTTRSQRRLVNQALKKFTKHAKTLVQKIATAQRRIDELDRVNEEREKGFQDESSRSTDRVPSERNARCANATSCTYEQARKDSELRKLADEAAINELAPFVDQQVFDGAGPDDLARQALDLLGIPWENF